MKRIIKVLNKSNNDLPEYATSGAAGMDVRAFIQDDNFVGDLAAYDEKSNSILLFSGGRALIHTGLYFEVPQGYEIQVRPRSGLALKQGITVLNTPGTIDSDYRGELGIILFNTSNEPFEVKSGDRIAQIVLNKVETIKFEKVKTLSDTTRGSGGFGHSGK